MLGDDIVTLIQADGFGTPAVSLFKGFLPDTPDEAAAVTETPGAVPVGLFGEASPAIERPRFQLRVRGLINDHDAPRLRMERIYQALGARSGAFMVNSTRYMALIPIQAPFALPKDKNDRWVFAVNFEAWKERDAAAMTVVDRKICIHCYCREDTQGGRSCCKCGAQLPPKKLF